MAEDPRLLLHFKTLAKFKEKLADGTVNPNKHFVIIKDEKLIWIRGIYYSDNTKLEGIDSIYNNWNITQTNADKIIITLTGKEWNSDTRTWGSISKSLEINKATQTIAGLMSALDKTKLDRVNGTNYSIANSATSATSREVKLTGINPNDGTIVHSEFTIPSSTLTEAGLMSAVDKKAIDNLAKESFTHVKDENTFTAGANDVKLNFSCRTTTMDTSEDSTLHSIGIGAASSTRAGVMTSTDKTELDRISTANFNVANVSTTTTNVTVNATKTDITSGTTVDDSFTIPAANNNKAGVMTSDDYVKLHTTIPGNIDSAKDELVNTITQEVNRAKAAEKVLTDNLAAEVTRATTKENELASAIANNTAALNAEIKRSTDEDEAIKASITDITADATALNKKINDEIIRATAKENELKNSIDATNATLTNEITRATTKDAELTKSLSDEVTRAKQAEKILTDSLNSEIERSTTKDTLLNSAINAEVARATAAENKVADDLTTEISRATATENANTVSINNHKADKTNPHSVTKALVGLGNVDNTSDANKPVSTAQATAIADAKKAGTDAQSSITAHAARTDNPHSVTKAQVGLGNVTNESKATMFNNAALTGIPTAPTAKAGTSTTQIATTAFVQAAAAKAVTDIVAGADESFDTLKEISDWISTHSNSAATMNSLINTNKNNIATNTSNISAIQSKLNGIASGAEVNVQSDWNVTDSSSDAFIKNKPTSLPANGGNANTVNGHTVNSDVPANAKFTDTTYSNATTTTAGLMSALDKVNLDASMKSIKIGTVTTGAAGTNASASVTNNNTTHESTLNLTIPRGATGTNGTNGKSINYKWDGTALKVWKEGETEPTSGVQLKGTSGTNGTNGQTPNITIGTVNNGTTAAATITGTTPNLTLNLTLPKGADGTNATTTSVATTTTNGLMSAADKAKLNNIASNANNYSLPTASSTVLGGVKVGAGLTINSSTGVLSATGGGTADSVDWNNVTSKPGNATTTTDGFMSKEDKTKLNSISQNALLNLYAYSYIRWFNFDKNRYDSLNADTATDAITFSAGDNISISGSSTNGSNKTLSISANIKTYGAEDNITSSGSGLSASTTYNAGLVPKYTVLNMSVLGCTTVLGITGWETLNTIITDNIKSSLQVFLPGSEQYYCTDGNKRNVHYARTVIDPNEDFDGTILNLTNSSSGKFIGHVIFRTAEGEHFTTHFSEYDLDRLVILKLHPYLERGYDAEFRFTLTRVNNAIKLSYSYSISDSDLDNTDCEAIIFAKEG